MLQPNNNFLSLYEQRPLYNVGKYHIKHLLRNDRSEVVRLFIYIVKGSV